MTDPPHQARLALSQREAAEALDHKTDDEKTGTGDYSEHEDYGGVDDRASAPPYSASAPLKRGRSTSPHPAPLPKKNKNARKHKKAHYVRAERRKREGHALRPKIVQRNTAAGASIKTSSIARSFPRRMAPTWLKATQRLVRTQNSYRRI